MPRENPLRHPIELLSEGPTCISGPYSPWQAMKRRLKGFLTQAPPGCRAPMPCPCSDRYPAAGGQWPRSCRTRSPSRSGSHPNLRSSRIYSSIFIRNHENSLHLHASSSSIGLIEGSDMQAETSEARTHGCRGQFSHLQPKSGLTVSRTSRLLTAASPGSPGGCSP